VYTKAGLITTREEKHSGDTLLTGMNLKHTLFDDFRTHKTAAAAAASGGEAAAGPTTAAAVAAGGQDADLEQLLVEEVYVPSKEVKRKCACMLSSYHSPTRALSTGHVCGPHRTVVQGMYVPTKMPNVSARNALACDALACDALACDALACDALACDALACDHHTWASCTRHHNKLHL
jgi:hypothetical protein